MSYDAIHEGTIRMLSNIPLWLILPCKFSVHCEMALREGVGIELNDENKNIVCVGFVLLF